MVETDSLSFVLSWCSIPFYITGLIGNVLVIRIVHKTREMHTSTNYLLASMAVSDVFTIILIAAHRFAFSQHVLDENVWHLVCKASAVNTTFITIFAIVSSTTLTVLAVERYNALLKPLRTGLQLSEDNIKKAIALIWVISVFVSIPNAFSQEFDRINRVRSGCVGQRDSIINLAWTDSLDCIKRSFFDTIGSHGILLWFLDQRSPLHQHSLPRKWNHWWREKLGEEETCYHIPSSDSRVFDRLCTLCGFSHCCCISIQREYRYQAVLSSPECVLFYV